MASIEESTASFPGRISEEHSHFSKPYLGYVLGLLAAANALNYLDRMVLAVLVEPIKAEFHATDTQMGLLTGFAFALLFAGIGLPVARLVDRGDRRLILSASVLAWSAMTAVSGLARSFGQLLACRVGVGIGEAGCFPAGHSLIGDYFRSERRSTASALFTAGGGAGTMLGLIIGGALSQHYSWRTTLLVAGLPGVLVAVLVLTTLKNPPRAALDPAAATPGVSSTYQSLVALFARPTYRHLVLGYAMLSFTMYATSAWAPAYLMRTLDLEPMQAGVIAAAVGGLGTLLGMIVGGPLGDRAIRRVGMSGALKLCAIALLLALPVFCAALLTSSAAAYAIFSSVGAVLACLTFGPSLAAIHSTLTSRNRGFGLAVVMLATSIAGIGAGPLVVGALSDALQSHLHEHSLRAALLLALGGIAWSSVHFVIASRAIRRCDAASRPHRDETHCEF